MRALVFHGPKRLGIEERPDPSPGAGEALVRVRAAGICGSDIHGAWGETGRRVPGLIMGHEAAGEIAALGEGVKDLKVGDRVALYPVVSCGACEACRAGDARLCPERRLAGVHPTFPGAFADLFTAPARNLVRISPATPWSAAALAEPLAVSLHAVNLLRPEPGHTIAVIGAGPIGLCAVLAARWRGHESVVALDLIEERLRLAAQLGASAVNVRSADPAQDVVRLAGGRVRYALDAVGVTDTLRTALRITRPGAAVVVVGLGNPEVRLPLFDVVTEERHLVGSYCYTEDEYRTAVGLIDARRVVVDPLVQRTCALDEAAQAFRDLAEAKDPSAKVVVLV